MAKKQLTPPPKPTDQKGAQPAAPVEQSPSPEPGSLAESRQPEAIPALETPQLSPVPQPPSSQSAPASAEPASVAPEARTPRTAPAQVEAEQKSATPTRRPAEPILPPQALPVAEVKPTAMSGPVVDPKFPHAARPDVPATPAQPEQVPAGAPAAERAAEPARPTPIVQSKSDTAQAIIAQTPPIAPAKAAAPGATAIESETPAARPASGSSASAATPTPEETVRSVSLRGAAGQEISAVSKGATESSVVETSEPAASRTEPAESAARRASRPISEEEIVRKLPQIKEPVPEAEDAREGVAEAHAGFSRSTQPMFIVMVTPEFAPVAKVGGLADVVFGLARELELRGNAVEIILPKYNCMRYDHIWGLSPAYERLWVPWYNGAIETTVWFGTVHGRKCFFIDPHSRENFFNRGAVYGQHDDVSRFAFFCRATLEFMLKTGKHPEIIHCHDWQTALVPVLLYEIYQHLGMRHPRVCFTVHNFRHQGTAGDYLLRASGLHRPEHFFHYDRLRDNHNQFALNLTKGGIVYSNFVTTVSPRHAWEAKDAGQGHGLEPTLHRHHYKFGGVINGVDYEMFNPETDPYIPSHYNAQSIDKKFDNKRALRRRLWLSDNEKPIIGFIGRLDPQKGLDLVRHAIFYALNNRAQFVLLGESPDRAINDHFWGLKRQLNESPDCHLEISYNEELGHLVYAGADMMLVPSRFEPCGLAQLISMRYGTVPLVRSVGGLADTVFDKDHSNRPLHERNGYVFHHADVAGVESALWRAIGCYYHFPEHFRKLMLQGMRCDCSWSQPAQHYLNIYEHIRDK